MITFKRNVREGDSAEAGGALGVAGRWRRSRDELRTGLRGLIGGMEICKTWFMVLVVNLGCSQELPKSLH